MFLINWDFDLSDIVFLIFLVSVLIAYIIMCVCLHFESKREFEKELKRLQEKDDAFWQEQEQKAREKCEQDRRELEERLEKLKQKFDERGH